MSGFVDDGVMIARSPAEKFLVTSPCRRRTSSARLRPSYVLVGNHLAGVRRGLRGIVLAGGRGAVIQDQRLDLVARDAVALVARRRSPS